ncbi:RNA-directed DNA polymerase, eukaryota, reverse transcriptase zinc-binding domain protein [Tanacetum coccineum]
MSNMKRTLKRKKRVPNKFDDTIFDLNNKKVDDETGVSTDVSSVDGIQAVKSRETVEVEEARKEDEFDNVNESRDSSLMDDNCGVNYKDFGVADNQDASSGSKSASKIKSTLRDESLRKTVSDNGGRVFDEEGQMKHSKAQLSSYVNAALAKNNDVNRSLFEKPTEVDEDGNEYVVYDETIISEGCKRWELTLYGYFVGHQITMNELRYNLKRMWGRKGFKDVVDMNNGVFLMKFYNEDGLESVVNKPTHIPIWVRMCNIPLEAWTTSGISALASRLGKPLVMDTITAKICKKGVSRVKYARVLVEVPTNKCIPEEIEVVYRDKDRMEICRKKIIVKFDCIPPRCSKCYVFGHDISSCGKVDHGKANVVNMEESNVQDKKKDNGANGARNYGFIKVPGKFDNNVGVGLRYMLASLDGTESGYRRTWTRCYIYGGGKKQQSGPSVQSHKPEQKQGGPMQKPMNQIVFQEKNVGRKDSPQSPRRDVTNENCKGASTSSPNRNGSGRKAWSVQGDMLNAFKSANKYVVLKNIEIDNIKDDNVGSIPIDVDTGEVNDVFRDENGIAHGMKNDVIVGIDKGVIKDCQIRKFMKDERLSICAILETRIKSKKLLEIGDGIFKHREWINNMRYCDKGCRIIMGWDNDNINLTMPHYCKQSILCKIKDIRGKLIMFYDVVYAANGGNERRDLWKYLSLYQRIVADQPWAIIGVMNVTLDPSDHSAGNSSMTKDMQEFKDSMRNEALVYEYPQAHTIFLPYLISDHFPVVLSMPNTMQGKKKSFRFSNFVTDNEEFHDLVKDNWDESHTGCQMFKLTKKLKALKKPLKTLAWKNGNLFDNVKMLREKLKDVQ